jgi:hypothetical protein
LTLLALCCRLIAALLSCLSAWPLLVLRSLLRLTGLVAFATPLPDGLVPLSAEPIPVLRPAFGLAQLVTIAAALPHRLICSASRLASLRGAAALLHSRTTLRT